MAKRKHSPCAHKIVKASGEKINLDEAQDILEDIDTAKEKLEQRGYDSSTATAKVVQEYFNNIQYFKKKEKLNVLRNAKIQTEILGQMQSYIDQGLRVDKAFKALTVGIESPLAGTRNSIDLYTETVTNGYAGQFMQALEAEGLAPILISEKFTKDIANDLWELSYNRPAKSKNPQVRRVAEIIRDNQEAMRLRMNKAGAEVNSAEGFIVSQSHDQDKMMKGGYEAWRAHILPKLDIEKSFQGTVDADTIEEALKGAFEGLVTGVRKSHAIGEDNPKLFQYSGPSNLAKKRSQARQLVFKTADDYLAYNDQFGRLTFNEALEMGIRRAGQDIALLERLGTNPKAMLENILKKLKEKNRETLAGGQKFSEAQTQNQIRVLTGEANYSVNRKLSDISGGIRAYNNMLYLGKAALTQVTDIPLKALEYRFQGRGLLSSWGATFTDFSNMFTSKQKKIEFASLTSVFADQWLADINSKLSGGKDFTSGANRLTRLFFKLNLQRPWDAANKTSMSVTMAHDLGLKSKLSYTELDDNTKRIFQNYDIGEAEWEVIRKNNKKLEDNNNYIVADGIEDQAIRDKLSAYFIDRVHHATSQVTGSTKTLMSMGIQRGTVLGEVMHLTWQFKSFMVSHIEKVWGREIHARGKADYAGMAQLLLMSIVFGYISGLAKDIISNRTPKDPFSPDTIADALVRGGGIGIAGDLLFKDNTGYGRNTSDVFLGPTASHVNDFFKTYQKVLSGDDPAAHLFNVGMSKIPFNNLFYIRQPLNEVLLYSIQEHLNSGYLKRMDKRLKDKYGAEQIVKTR